MSISQLIYTFFWWYFPVASILYILFLWIMYSAYRVGVKTKGITLQFGMQIIVSIIFYIISIKVFFHL